MIGCGLSEITIPPREEPYATASDLVKAIRAALWAPLPAEAVDTYDANGTGFGRGSEFANFWLRWMNRKEAVDAIAMTMPILDSLRASHKRRARFHHGPVS